MKRRTLLIVSAGLLLLIVPSAILVSLELSNNVSNNVKLSAQSFYSGVTYCGDNVTEAKLLIDRVKNFTNLFVIQSGPLQENTNGMIEICDYAAKSGLHTLVYFSVSQNRQQLVSSFLSKAQAWESDMGIYFDDEPGGKMIDNGWDVHMYDPQTNDTIVKHDAQHVYITRADMTQLRYEFDRQKGWSVLMSIRNQTEMLPSSGFYSTISYRFESNGTIFLLNNNGKVASQIYDTSNLPFKSYQEVMAYQPFKTYDQAEQIFVNNYQHNVDWLKSPKSVKAFTSDYGLYWFDYLSGYDVVLAQLGGNNTIAQEIGLVRGAASLQNKDWGVILTWKYTNPPYLAGGAEMYEQMKSAYESGAKYAIVFNYADNMKGHYGTLQEEHFTALEHFWNDVVQKPNIVHGNVKAEAAFVLPKNYGFGLRNPNDSIWGFWGADNQAQQIWVNLQKVLDKYGLQLDIVYNDSRYDISGNYSQVYYWNQTS